MKKLIIIGLCVIMIIGLFGVVTSSNSNEISVYLNGERLEFDVAPIIVDNRVMTPFRAIFEAFGFEVRWFERDQSITAGKDRISIQLWIDKAEMDVYILPAIEPEIPQPISPWRIPLAVPPMLVDGRTLVPIRAFIENLKILFDYLDIVVEGLDVDVDWDEENRAVIITNFSWEEIAPWNR